MRLSNTLPITRTALPDLSKYATSIVALRPRTLALAYLVSIVLAEFFTTILNPIVGVIMYCVLLVALLVHTAYTWDRPVHRLLMVLAIAPLIRLTSVSLPLMSYPPVDRYLIVSIPLFVAAILMLRMLKPTLPSVNFNLRKLPIQILFASTGLVFGVIEYAILRPEPLIPALTWDQLLVPALILLVCTGFLEELLFRGVMQPAATERFGRFGILYVAVIFAVMHMGDQSIEHMVFVLGVGVIFGWMAHKTRNLLGVSVAHGITNILLLLVLPLAPWNNIVQQFPSSASVLKEMLQTEIPMTMTANPTIAPTLQMTPPPPTSDAGHFAGDFKPLYSLPTTPLPIPFDASATSKKNTDNAPNQSCRTNCPQRIQ